MRPCQPESCALEREAHRRRLVHVGVGVDDGSPNWLLAFDVGRLDEVTHTHLRQRYLPAPLHSHR